MEVSINEFREILQKDKLFAGYLNAFLNLPNFAKRLTYCSDADSFDIQPRVDTELYVVNEDNVLNWVHSSRLPLFFGSELFYEFKLCQALNEDLQKNILTSVSSMYDFKKFLFQTEGESSYLFWMDVERLKWNVRSQLQRRKLILRINQMYVSDGAPFQLQGTYRECLISTHKSDKPLQKCSTKQQIKELMRCQEQVILTLRNYWCKRYSVKIEEERVRSEKRKKDEIGQKRSSLSNSKVLSENKKRTKESIEEEKIQTFITDKGNSVDSVAKKASQIKISTSSTKLVPLLPSEQRNILTHAVSNDSIAKIAILSHNTPTILLSSSTCSLFSAPSAPGIHHSLSSENSNNICLNPYLSASLRADFTAGNGFLRYLKKNSPSPQAANYLLFWQSVENILMQDEMKRWYTTTRSCINLKEDGNDKQSPYLSYFETYFTAKNLQELCLFFLQPKAIHRIVLPDGVEGELGMLLPRGLGHGLLLATQEYARNSLLKPWMDYLMLDHDQFIKSSVTPKLYRKLSPSFRKTYMKETVIESLGPEEIASNTYNISHSPSLATMWDALKFSEAIKYAGVHQLPSRNATDKSLHDLCADPSGEHFVDEMEAWDTCADEEGGGVFLSPMITTVKDEMTWDMEKHKQKRTLKFTTTPPSLSFGGAEFKAPTDMLEILNDRAHLDYFKKFMTHKGHTQEETSLRFWHAVEDLKISVNDKKKYQNNLKKIKEHYLTAEKIKSMIHTDPTLEEQFSKCKEDPNLHEYITTQNNIRASLQKKWLRPYIEHIAAEERKKKMMERKSAERRLAALRNKKAEELTKYRMSLWNQFAQKVLRFKRAVMNPGMLAQFRKYLRDQVAQDDSIINTKFGKVQRSKLLNDLGFWTEVERYKGLVGDMREGQKSGMHTPEDYIMIFKKAHAITNCYLDSSMDPPIQINISNYVAKQLLDNVRAGKMTFGLFHEAAMTCFNILIPHWRRFCINRATNKKRPSLSVRKGDKRSSIHSGGSILSGGSIHSGGRRYYFIDGGPILSFSLRFGLRWMYPNGRYVRIPCTPTKPKAVSLTTFQPLLDQPASMTTLKPYSRTTSLQCTSAECIGGR